MSDLIVIGFKEEFKADEVLLDLLKLERDYLIDLEDAAIVIRNKDGKVKIKQTQELIADGAIEGGFWGLLLGMIFFNPILGIFGLAVGALSGAVWSPTPLCRRDERDRRIGDRGFARILIRTSLGEIDRFRS